MLQVYNPIKQEMQNLDLCPYRTNPFNYKSKYKSVFHSLSQMHGLYDSMRLCVAYDGVCRAQCVVSSRE